MTIYVQRTDGGALRVRDGSIRLRAALIAFGYADVTDIVTNEQFRVSEVDGVLVVTPLQPASSTSNRTAD